MLQRLRTVILKSKASRSVFVLMGGTATAQAITVISMPIITRLYTPEMIGLISIYLSFFTLFLTILSCRYESALFIARSESDSHHVFRLSAILCLINSLIAIPIFMGLQQKSILGFGELPDWTPIILFMSLLGYGLFMIYRCWLLRLEEVRAISQATVYRAGANSGIRITFGLFVTSPAGLFLAEVAGSWAALVSVRKKTNKLLAELAPEWSYRKLKEIAYRYRRFAQFEMPSAFVNQLAIAFQIPMVASLYGTKAAGWFGLARLLYAIPNGQIGKAAGDVLQMEFGRCVRGGAKRKRIKVFNKFSSYLAIVGIVPLLGALFVAPKLVPWIFGASWQEMGTIIAYIAPWMYMSLVVSSLSRVLLVLEKQHLKLIYDFIFLTLVLALYMFSLNESIEFYSFVTLLTISGTLSYVLYFFIIIKAIK